MHKILIYIMLLVVAGCSSSGPPKATSSHILTGSALAPISSGEVRVYREAPARFEEVAILNATSSSRGSDQEKVDQVVDALKADAAGLGANGVIIIKFGSEQEVYGHQTGDIGYTTTSTRRTVEAIAITTE